MGIFDFLKKLVKENRVEEIVSEKLAFSEIKSWLENKDKENEVKEKEILVLIKEKIKDFNSDLRVKITILNDFDVESKKAEDRIKGIVNSSRIQYIEAIEDLMVNLEGFKETKFSDFIKRIDKIFLDFDKASFKNYEGATILIGKEMANIKEGLKKFSKDLLESFNNNKEIPELSQSIELIKSKLNLLNSIEENIAGVSEAIVSINDKLDNRVKENKRLLEDIEKIKQSEDYKDTLEKKEKIRVLKEESNNAISTLRQLIDFKALANFFHINEKQMNILKNYKEDFQTNFRKDNGKVIIDFLDEAKLNNNVILEKVNLIKNKTEETSNCEKEIKEDETLGLYSQVKSVVLDIGNLKIERVKEEKRGEKLRANKGELVNSLKEELSKMNIEIVCGE